MTGRKVGMVIIEVRLKLIGGGIILHDVIIIP